MRLSANTLPTVSVDSRLRGDLAATGLTGTWQSLDRAWRPSATADCARDRNGFETQLHNLPQVTGAMRLTGEYDYQLRMACTSTRDFESVIGRLKSDLGARELRSRLLLHEVPLGLDRLPIPITRNPPAPAHGSPGRASRGPSHRLPGRARGAHCHSARL